MKNFLSHPLILVLFCFVLLSQSSFMCIVSLKDLEGSWKDFIRERLTVSVMAQTHALNPQ